MNFGFFYQLQQKLVRISSSTATRKITGEVEIVVDDRSGVLIFDDNIDQDIQNIPAVTKPVNMVMIGGAQLNNTICYARERFDSKIGLMTNP